MSDNQLIAIALGKAQMSQITVQCDRETTDKLIYNSIEKSSMNTIKNEIAQRLEIIPDNKLREVLSFLNYLVWQTENPRTQEDQDWLESELSGLDNYEPYEWQQGELQEGQPIKFIAETGKIEIGI